MRERDHHWDKEAYIKDEDNLACSSSPDPMNIDPNINMFKPLIQVDGVLMNMFNEDPQLYKLWLLMALINGKSP